MDGEAGAHLLLGLDDNGFAFLAEIGALGGHVQGVKYMLHGRASAR